MLQHSELHHCASMTPHGYASTNISKGLQKIHKAKGGCHATTFLYLIFYFLAMFRHEKLETRKLESSMQLNQKGDLSLGPAQVHRLTVKPEKHICIFHFLHCPHLFILYNRTRTETILSNKAQNSIIDSNI